MRPRLRHLGRFAKDFTPTTHLGFATNYNYMPISGLQYGSLLLQPITSAASAAAGFSSPYPSFASQRGANTVYQSLRPYPQYTAVTTGGGVFFGGPAPGGVADPANISIMPRAAGTGAISSFVEVPGDGAAFYDSRPVPHGEVRMVLYRSKAMGVDRYLRVYTPLITTSQRGSIRFTTCFTETGKHKPVG